MHARTPVGTKRDPISAFASDGNRNERTIRRHGHNYPGGAPMGDGPTADGRLLGGRHTPPYLPLVTPSSARAVVSCRVTRDPLRRVPCSVLRPSVSLLSHHAGVVSRALFPGGAERSAGRTHVRGHGQTYYVLGVSAGAGCVSAGRCLWCVPAVTSCPAGSGHGLGGKASSGIGGTEEGLLATPAGPGALHGGRSPAEMLAPPASFSPVSRETSRDSTDCVDLPRGPRAQPVAAATCNVSNARRRYPCKCMGWARTKSARRS